MGVGELRLGHDPRTPTRLLAVSAGASQTPRVASRNNAVGEMLHAIRKRPKIVMAALGAVVLTAVGVSVIATSRGSGPAPLVPQGFVVDPCVVRDPSCSMLAVDLDGTRAAPYVERNKFLASVYEFQRAYCHQRWSALLFEAGEPRSTPFSRTALRATAAKLPGARRFIDELNINVATNGCVAGFLEFLDEDRAYALS